jgi:hypothetical protein
VHPPEKKRKRGKIRTFQRGCLPFMKGKENKAKAIRPMKIHKLSVFFSVCVRVSADENLRGGIVRSALCILVTVYIHIQPPSEEKESTTTIFPVSLFNSLWIFDKNLYAKGNAASVISHRADTAHAVNRQYILGYNAF